ncbi:MAG: hypothetical protein U9P79_03665 [Candidatus Cloacimonadota bacterium]|nr:hypothetical protein [Candidatus Cloacimonadota bacterium]
MSDQEQLTSISKPDQNRTVGELSKNSFGDKSDRKQPKKEKIKLKNKKKSKEQPVVRKHSTKSDKTSSKPKTDSKVTGKGMAIDVYV